jgi:hypothetical protein
MIPMPEKNRPDCTNYITLCACSPCTHMRNSPLYEMYFCIDGVRWHDQREWFVRWHVTYCLIAFKKLYEYYSKIFPSLFHMLIISASLVSLLLFTIRANCESQNLNSHEPFALTSSLPREYLASHGIRR